MSGHGAEPVAPASCLVETGLDETDRAAVRSQLGRPPRGAVGVAHRCGCGQPDVVATAPRLEDGTPFPTTFYLTCPRASSAVGTLEASGLMREMAQRLEEDDELAASYAAAHDDYLARRAALEAQRGEVPEIAGTSAGGMPARVKCLHALLGHALAAGPGVNPLGDEVRERLGAWWAEGPCAGPRAAPGATSRATPSADPSAGS